MNYCLHFKGRDFRGKSESDFFPHAEDPQKAVYILVGTTNDKN